MGESAFAARYLSMVIGLTFRSLQALGHCFIAKVCCLLGLFPLLLWCLQRSAGGGEGSPAVVAHPCCCRLLGDS